MLNRLFAVSQPADGPATALPGPASSAATESQAELPFQEQSLLFLHMQPRLQAQLPEGKSDLLYLKMAAEDEAPGPDREAMGEEGGAGYGGRVDKFFHHSPIF